MLDNKDHLIYLEASTNSDREQLKKVAATSVVLGTIAMTSQPAEANVADVAAEVASLATLAGAALAVALVPFGLFFAFKIVRKVMAGA